MLRSNRQSPRKREQLGLKRGTCNQEGCPINWTGRKCGHASTHDSATAVKRPLYKTRRSSQYRKALTTESLNAFIEKSISALFQGKQHSPNSQ